VRTWALLLGIAAIAVAAVVDAVRSSGSGAATLTVDERGGPPAGDETLAGPDSPPPGALPGKLVVVAGEECRLRVIDLAGPTLGPEGPPTDCGLWSPASSDVAAVSQPWEPGTPSPFARVALVRLAEPPEPARKLGLAAGEVAWSADSTRVALCGTNGKTAIHDVGGEIEREVDGCGPRFASDGSLLTSPTRAFGDHLLRDGEIELDAADLMQGFDPSTTGELDVLAYDESADGLLAVSVLRLEPLGSRAVLQLWQDGVMVAGVELPRRYGVGSKRFGEYVRFNPTGTVLALGPSATRNSMTFVDLRLRRTSLQLDYQRAFAWSPDGQWLAVALDHEIAVYSQSSAEPVYRLPLEVSALGWTAGAEDEG
jgi:hypothetical protein